jgi:hypothetical protein
MKRIIAVGAVIAIVFFAGVSWAANVEKEKAAITAAQQWLALVDAGKYSESWKEAAEYFRNAVPQEQWKQMLQSVRGPLGKKLSRKLKIKEYKTSLPGAPDGEYVVIQYETSYQNKKSAVETVTPMLDKDGKWRVAGYYIN